MEKLELDKPERITRHGKKSSKSVPIRLYIYFFVGTFTLIVVLSTLWSLMQDSPTAEMQRAEAPIDLSALNNPTPTENNEAKPDTAETISNSQEQLLAEQTGDPNLSQAQTTTSSNLPLVYANNGGNVLEQSDTTLLVPSSVPDFNSSTSELSPSNTQIIKSAPQNELNAQAVQLPIPDNTLQNTVAPTTNATTAKTISEPKKIAKPFEKPVTTVNTRMPKPQSLNTQTTSSDSVQETAAQLQASLNQQSSVTNSTQKQQATKQVTNNLPPVKPVEKNTRQRSTPLPKINNGMGGNYTIQVASASRPEGLRQLAVSQNLTTARVIETEKNGTKWYVLVTGRYGSSEEARRAIPTLPAKIRENQPWVRTSP